MGPVMNECSRRHPGVGLIVFERSAPYLEPGEKDFVFRWGPPAEVSTPAFTLGSDELTIVVNPDNPVNSMSHENLRSIYMGNVHIWSELDPVAGLNGNIQAWGYVQGEDVQYIFDENTGGRANNPMIHLAPDVKAMLQAVSSDPNAIGYLPRRWLNNQVSAVTVDRLNSAPQIPILVLTPTLPDGEKKDWLLCLQDQINQ